MVSVSAVWQNNAKIGGIMPDIGGIPREICGIIPKHGGIPFTEQAFEEYTYEME